MQIGTASFIGSVGAAQLGFSEAQSLPSVRATELLLPTLPRQWDGLTIAQVSDVHAGPYMEADRMRRIRDLVMALPADLVVFTGDQMDRRPSDAEAFVPGFSGIEAPLGVFGILGNHDHYIDPVISIQALQDAGIRPLVNSAVSFERDGARLHLVGLEDLGARGDSSPDFSLLERCSEGFRICLCHQPAGWRAARAAGAELTLAGHTHGGQIALPSRRVNVARLHSPYIAGEYRRGEAMLYVSRGIGVGAVPVRLGSPPEIDLLVLRRAHASARAAA